MSSANLATATPASMPSTGANAGVTKLISACTDSSATCPTAKRQAILRTPEIGGHPNGKDYIIYFGTGSDLSIGDLLDKRTQSVYGIWDRGTGTTINRSSLLTQTISSISAGRQVTQNPIVWLSSTLTPVNLGWVEDLPASGERMVGGPSLDSGILYYNTFVSSANPCDMGGYGYLMAVSYQNGGMLTTPLFDSNGDGKINSADTLLAGVQVNSVASSSIIDTAGVSGYAYIISSLVYPVSSSSSTSSAGSSASASSAGSAASASSAGSSTSASSAHSSTASSAGSSTSASSTGSSTGSSASSTASSSGSASSSSSADATLPIGEAGARTYQDVASANSGCVKSPGDPSASVVCIKPPLGAALPGVERDS